ncbi:MAG: DUF3299 domain-containing protein [Comamonas sp.]
MTPAPHSLHRRQACRWLAASCAALLPGALPLASAQPGPTRQAAPTTISWDALVPAGWDPAAGFEGVNPNQLSDSDPRAQQLLARMRKRWDEAPVNTAMDGRAVRLPGYVVPLEGGRDGLREFLLVPYFGACIHTPPPPANQIIHVVLDKPSRLAKSMDAVWLTGVLRTGRVKTEMGQGGYRMRASGMELYTEKKG